MKCPKCDFENLEKANFCNECGNKLEILCPSCTTSLAFTFPGCTGKAATGTGQTLSQLFYEQYSDKYCVVDFTVDPIFEFQSRSIATTGQRQDLTFSGPGAVVKELTNFPFTAGKLTFPIKARNVE